MNPSTTPMIECPKCLGRGRFAAFAHIESGACFRCGGSGTVKAPKERAPKVHAPVVMAAGTIRFRLATMREAARENGECWFATTGIPGVGLDTVRCLAEMLPAEEGAAVIAEFDALRVEVARAERERSNRPMRRNRR